MAKLNAKYMILRDGEEVARSYGVEGIPTLVVVGKDGKVKLRESGWGGGSEQKLAAAIEDALGQ